jgi:hypothetical protein
VFDHHSLEVLQARVPVFGFVELASQDPGSRAEISAHHFGDDLKRIVVFDASHFPYKDFLQVWQCSRRGGAFEFYQLLTYRDEAVWEHFYNFDRPHGAHSGKTPYEALREKLS